MLSSLAGKDEVQDQWSEASEGHGDRFFQILIHPKLPGCVGVQNVTKKDGFC